MAEGPQLPPWRSCRQTGLTMQGAIGIAIKSPRPRRTARSNAITAEYYSRIPEFLENYDKLTKSPNKSRSTQNEVIIYEKEFEEGYVYYLEEKRDKRKSLAFQTMYKKKKGTDSSDGLMLDASPSTPEAPSDNLSSVSEDKDNALLGEKQGKEELCEIYNNLPAVKKDGIEIELYRSAFKKIYKEDGLFGQIVPVLDEVLEQSVLAYSEDNNLGGVVRPDGTIHKGHENIVSFDNYVGKVRLNGKEYYVRTTVQREKTEWCAHSFFVSNVDVYENPTESRTIPITSRGTTNFEGIVDAKLQQFLRQNQIEHYIFYGS